MVWEGKMEKVNLICPICGKRLLTTDECFSVETKCERCSTFIVAKGVNGEIIMHYETKKVK